MGLAHLAPREAATWYRAALEHCTALERPDTERADLVVRLGEALHRILAGRGRVEDLPLLDGIARGMTGTCFCPLGESVPPTIYSTLRFFRQEYEHHVKTGRCDVEALA